MIKKRELVLDHIKLGTYIFFTYVCKIEEFQTTCLAEKQ